MAAYLLVASCLWWISVVLCSFGLYTVYFGWFCLRLMLVLVCVLLFACWMFCCVLDTRFVLFYVNSVGIVIYTV